MFLPTAHRIFACAVVLAAASFLFFFISNKQLFEKGGLPGTDFVAFYSGAVLASCCPNELYQAPAQFRIEASLSSAQFQGWKLYYVYPPFFSAGLIPLSYLSYTQAYWLWTAASVALYVLSLCLLPVQNHALQISTVAAATPALYWVLFAGQTTALAVFFWTLGYYFLCTRRFFSSGFIFAMLAYRPQFLILVFPLGLLRFPRALSIGFAAGFLLLFTIGGLAISFDSYRQYGLLLGEFTGQLRENIHPLHLHISLYGFFRPLLPENWSIALTGAFSALVFYWLAHAWLGAGPKISKGFRLEFAGLIPSTLLIMPHSLVYDLLLLNIVALLLEEQKSGLRRYYRVPLAALYCYPLVSFFFAGLFALNPVPPLLLWLCFELYRARKKDLLSNPSSSVFTSERSNTRKNS